MSLYRIIVLHGAPKDSHTSTETYLRANDDREVSKWIEDTYFEGHWFTPYESDESPSTRYDEDSDSDVTFHEYILKNRGDLKDDEGWEE